MDGNITAYAFNVMKNNQYDGYIIISATKDKYPVLEFSKGELPTDNSTMTKKSQCEAGKYANKNKLNVGKSIPIYEGATFYYKEYDLKDNKNTTKEKVIVDLTTSKIINENTENLSSSTDKAETTDIKEIKEAWNNLENRMTGERNGLETLVTTTATSKDISGVPYYSANYIGCAPAAGAMVLGYWDNNGYSNLPSGNTLMSELATAMGTYQYNTSISMVDDGIETVCSNHGYTNFDAIQYSGTMYMSNVVSEINANKPFVLCMINGGARIGGSNYGNHAVTCMGYYYQGTTQYLNLHDGWDTSAAHYITYGNWGSATPVWVRP